MGIGVKDTFTDADGTLIENHTPDVGEAWNHWLGSNAIIQDNKAYQPNAAHDIFVHSVKHFYHIIKADFGLSSTTGGNRIVEVGFRENVGPAGTDIFVQVFKINAAPYDLRLILRDGAFSLGSYITGSLLSGNVKLELSGAKARAYLNNSVVIDWATVSAPIDNWEGYAFFSLRGLESSLDNFLAESFRFGSEPFLDFVTPHQMVAKKMIKSNKKVSINPVTGNIVINRNGRVFEMRHANIFNIYKYLKRR